MGRYEKALGPHEEKTLLVILRFEKCRLKLLFQEKLPWLLHPLQNASGYRWLNHKENVC